jgi:hypothetical protein
MACPNCGSWAVKADRGLAGRMVCARCGRVLGLGSGGGKPRWRRGSRPWRPWLGLAVLLAVSALLASQPQAPQPQPAGSGAVPIR